MPVPKYTYNSWDNFEMLGSVSCNNTKYAVLRLIDPKNTKLKVENDDTLTINKNFYRNIYVTQYNINGNAGNVDLWTQNKKSNIYLVGTNKNYGKIPNCKALEHLTLLEKIASPTPVK